MNNEIKTTPSEESMHVQLAELNSRSRWYSSELWQVPFAYLGLSGLLIGQAVDKTPEYLPVIFFASAVFGFFVAWHMQRLRDSEQRAIRNLQGIEKALMLPVTAKTGTGLKIFHWPVIFATAAYFGAAIYLYLK